MSKQGENQVLLAEMLQNTLIALRSVTADNLQKCKIRSEQLQQIDLEIQMELERNSQDEKSCR